MKKMKKFLAVCLALMLLLACLPVTGVMAVSGNPAEKEEGDITIPITPVTPTPPQEENTTVTDLDCNDKTDTDDAVYLLLNVMFGDEDYPLPINANTDYDGSEKVDHDDAVYLLLYVMFGEEDYPLYPKN